MTAVMAPTPEPTPAADASFDRELLALRERLRAARAERGACPPWTELRDDLLPGGGSRAGREERLAHRELCPYCDAAVREWEQSLDKTADTLGAIEKGVARGVVAGALKLVSFAGGAAAKPAAAPPPAPTEPPPAPLAAVPPPPVPPAAAPPPLRVVPPPPDRQPATYVPPAERPAPPPPSLASAPPPRPGTRERATPRRAAPTPPTPPTPPPPPSPPPAPRAPARVAPSAPAGPIRLLVVEVEHERAIPQSVFLCAAVLEAEVAAVPRVEALGGDPDLDAVCGVVFAGGREPADWPAAVRRAKDLVPGKPVVVLVPPGQEPAGGARRAIGAILLGAGDPPERLLLALDARLR
jgi:hypothetical protein